MNIAVNCWILRNKKLDGIGYFTVNAIGNLIKDHPDVHFQVLCDKKFTEPYFDFPNVTKHRIFPALRHPLLYVYYMDVILPFFLRKHKPDVMVSADGYLSLLSACRQIPVIYDINFEHKPKDVKLKNRLYFRFFFRRFAHKAKRIATISEYSKQDIAAYYKIDPDQIDNVSCGINSNFFPLEQQEVINVRNKWCEGKPYFFFVGSMHPRKNIKGLIDAFSLFKERTGSGYKLVLAGSILWSKTEIENSYENSPYKKDIIFTGRLPDEDLQKMLGAAFALSFVPIFEGFGLPIVEAMQCGVPVICSNVTSMPEVAGDAALMVDPFSIDSIAAGMEQLSADDELRNRLIAKGHIQKKLFSWNRTAQLLWECICKTTGTKINS
ncbi:MAG: glycosyltransferase family 4 protein [Ferruginibacter sp.]|nr:glycosyltransferase family 4 protein [Chitinophagaceae bacterium]